MPDNPSETSTATSQIATLQSPTGVGSYKAAGPNPWYLPEDYAFCERARRCGYQIMADTTIRLWHHGSYGYTWEDAGNDKPCYETFYFNVA